MQPLGPGLQPPQQKVGLIGGVTGQDFVGPIAGEDHLNFLGGKSGQIIDRDHGGIGGGLFAMPDQFGQDGLHLGSDENFMMFGAVAGGHLPGVGPFIIAFFAETDGKGFEATGIQGGCGSHHRGRVQATAQKSAHRDIGDEPQSDGIIQYLLQNLAVLFWVQPPELRGDKPGPNIL